MPNQRPPVITEASSNSAGKSYPPVNGTFAPLNFPGLPHPPMAPVLPQQSAWLQQLTAAASYSQAVAHLAAQQRGLLATLPTTMSAGITNRKPPSPDSTASKPSLPTINNQRPTVLHTPDGAPAPQLEGKQYLRYKILERQNRRLDSTQKVAAPPQPPTGGILGSLLDSGKKSFCPVSASNGLSLKQCLSSLAVQLETNPSNSTDSGLTDSSNSGGLLSESSDNSHASPISSHGKESHTSGSQVSPSHSVNLLGESTGCVKVSGSRPKRYSNDRERYVERRKRNNEAAKRCRANRRSLFEYRFQRAQQLEEENQKLKDEMHRLARELAELRELLARKTGFVGINNVSPSNNTDSDRHTNTASLADSIASIESGSGNEENDSPITGIAAPESNL